jgi:hypothetical protein
MFFLENYEEEDDDDTNLTTSTAHVALSEPTPSSLNFEYFFLEYLSLCPRSALQKDKKSKKP